jgi:hypothetical protein
MQMRLEQRKCLSPLLVLEVLPERKKAMPSFKPQTLDNQTYALTIWDNLQTSRKALELLTVIVEHLKKLFSRSQSKTKDKFLVQLLLLQRKKQKLLPRQQARVLMTTTVSSMTVLIALMSHWLPAPTIKQVQ